MIPVTNFASSLLVLVLMLMQEIQELDLLEKVLQGIDPESTFINFSSEFQRVLTEEGARRVAKNSWGKLVTINLGYNRITDEAFTHLSRCDWVKLQVLSLSSRNKLTSLGAESLAQANWKNIKKLDLQKNKIGPKGTQYISRADWANLQYINLNQCQVLEQGALHLSNANWPQLKSIHLILNNIGNKGVSYLSNANWPQLRQINLSYNKIDANGCYFLALCKWPKLQALTLVKNFMGLSGGKLSQLGAFYLTQIPCSLTRLQIQMNQLSSKGVALIINSNAVAQGANIQLHNNGFQERDMHLITKPVNI